MLSEILLLRNYCNDVFLPFLLILVVFSFIIILLLCYLSGMLLQPPLEGVGYLEFIMADARIRMVVHS